MVLSLTASVFHIHEIIVVEVEVEVGCDNERYIYISSHQPIRVPT